MYRGIGYPLVSTIKSIPTDKCKVLWDKIAILKPGLIFQLVLVQVFG